LLLNLVIWKIWKFGFGSPNPKIVHGLPGKEALKEMIRP
jgi:hypothetical protein